MAAGEDGFSAIFRASTTAADVVVIVAVAVAKHHDKYSVTLRMTLFSG